MQQICQMLADDTTRTYWSDEQQVPYLVYADDQWVGYDNAVSLSIKVSKSIRSVLAQWLIIIVLFSSCYQRSFNENFSD